MARALVVAGLFASMAFAGCVDDGSGKPSVDLDELLPEAVAKKKDGIYNIHAQVLEGRYVGGDNATFADAANAKVVKEPITLTKQEPGPMGGGGVKKTILSNVTGVQFEVRFSQPEKYDGLKARWYFLRNVVEEQGGGAVYDWDSTGDSLQPKPNGGAEGDLPCADFPPRHKATTMANESWIVDITDAGVVHIGAELLDKGKVVAKTCRSFRASVDLSFTVHSAVQPVGAWYRNFGDVRPDNFEEMYDQFAITIGADSGQLVATTRYRGTWANDQGYDVDLEVEEVGQTSRWGYGYNPCTISRSLPTLPQPDLFSTENVNMELQNVGTKFIRVGAIQTCAQGYGGSKGFPASFVEYLVSYGNTALVPYTLEVDLTFPKPGEQGRMPPPIGGK